ncbi:unnamed protein product, partial [marine sediment metagenome]
MNKEKRLRGIEKIKELSNEELIDAINTVKGRLIENKNLEITRKRKRNRRLS